MTSFVDFYRNAYARFPMECRTGGTVPLTLLNVAQDSHETVDRTGEEFAFFMLVESAVRLCNVDAGDGQRNWTAGAGAFCPHLPGTETLFRVEGRHRLIGAIAPRSAVVDRLQQGGLADPEPFRQLHGMEHYDPLAQRAIEGLWLAAARPGPAQALEIDGQFQLLLARLLHLSGMQAEPTPTLSPAQIARAMAVVEDRLEEGVTLGEMAAEAGFSAFHFARAFRDATGVTPHQFQIERRLARARELLAGDMALSEIAYACGFASQSHMTTTFSKHLGISPGRYRAEMLK